MRRPLALLALLPWIAACQAEVFGGDLTLCYCDGACPDDPGTCEQQIPSVLAAGQRTQWRIFVPDDTTVGKTITVTTSLGTLSPAAEPPGDQILQLQTQGTRPLDLALAVGTDPGAGRLTVTADGGLEASAELTVAPLVPCIRLVSVPTPDDCGSGSSDDPPPEPTPEDAYQACLDARDPVVQIPANGSTVEIEVVLPDDDLVQPLPQTLTLASTLAELRRGQANASALELTLAITPGQPARVLLRPGRDTGVGQLTAALAEQPPSVLEYEITEATEQLVLTPPEGPIIDDGRRYPFSLQLRGSALTGPQTVEVSSTLGRVSNGDGADRYQTTVLADPCELYEIDLVTDEQPGPGTLTAVLPGVTSTALGYEISPIVEDLSFVDPPVDDVVVADGVSVQGITLQSSSTRLTDRAIEVTSTLGAINPSGGGDPQRLELSIGPYELAVLPLAVGRDVGTEVLTALEADGFISDVVQFRVARSYPTYLTLVGTPSVLTQASPTASLVAYFDRTDERRVSYGTRVSFVACCDDSDPTDACELVQLPVSLTAEDDTAERVEAQLSLTPAGAALVGEVGAPPTDDVSVDVHAFVPGPTTDLDQVDCASLSLGLDQGFAAQDVGSFALQRLAP